MHRILLLLLACVVVGSTAYGYEGNDERGVHLSGISVLTLRANQFTHARRTAPVAQLKCLGGCERVFPDVVQCRNMGFDGVTAQWRCEATLPDNVEFDHVEVSCEGFSRPGDQNVLPGSCGLEFTLKTRRPPPNQVTALNAGPGLTYDPERMVVHTNDKPPVTVYEIRREPLPERPILKEPGIFHGIARMFEQLVDAVVGVLMAIVWVIVAVFVLALLLCVGLFGPRTRSPYSTYTDHGLGWSAPVYHAPYAATCAPPAYHSRSPSPTRVQSSTKVGYGGTKTR